MDLALLTEIKVEAKKELARRDFFFYCHLMAEDFYKLERSYLKEICVTLQNFLTSTDKILVLNVPP